MRETQKDIINKLRKDILLLEGFKPAETKNADSIGLGAIEEAFPNGIFPKGAIHEMLCPASEQLAATSGFMAGILSSLMKRGGACLWISLSGKLFPPSLVSFNVEPERVIFINLQRERDILWAMEEALKCEGLAAVIAELQDVSFAQSRRLQLAVEDSRVTGFLLRNDPRKVGTTTCVARWQVTSLPGEPEDGLPGVGFPRWQVDLLKVRNGIPGSWAVSWDGSGFNMAEEERNIIQLPRRKAG